MTMNRLEPRHRWIRASRRPRAARSRLRLESELASDLIAYLDAGPGLRGDLFAVAEQHVKRHAVRAARSGAFLSHTAAGFLSFRSSFVEQLVRAAARRRLDPNETAALLADAVSALDRLLFALMVGHRSTI